MAGIIQKGARRFTTQIAAAGVPDAVATTIPLVSVVGLPTDTTVEIVVDRTDSNGVLTPAKEEVIRGTVLGTNLINCIRGVEGTAQAHSAGATVNQFLTASMWNNVMDYILDTASASNGLIGGQIQVTVASNNLTVAIKTLQGTDPSALNPVSIYIGGVLRKITSALSVTANAGSNWLNSGSAELATREVDYFVYLQWDTVANKVQVAFSRIPYGNLISDFNISGISERGLPGHQNFTLTDTVVNIGRFAATLSAGAGHTWSVPTFNANNLIQRPIYETRWLIYITEAYGSGGSKGTYAQDSTLFKYKIVGNQAFIKSTARITNKGSWSGNVLVNTPIGAITNEFSPAVDPFFTSGIVPSGGNPATGSRGLFKLNVSNNLIAISSIFSAALQWTAVAAYDSFWAIGSYEI